MKPGAIGVTGGLSVTVDARDLAEARELLDSLSGRDLQNRTRRATRRGAAVMRTELRKEVKSGQHPRSFKKIATKGHRTPVGTSVGPTSPLLNIFEPGAGAHEISPGRLRVSGGRPMLLSGAAGEHYRTRAFVASMPVTHPGMAARPLVGPVFDKTHDEAAETAMDELLAGIR